MFRRLQQIRLRYVFASVLMLLALALVSVAFSIGFSTDRGTTAEPALQGGMLGSVIFSGQTSLEERILDSDVVARVKLVSVAQVVEKLSGENPMFPTRTRFVKALEFKFEVLEYLKGSGRSEIAAVALDWDRTYDTEQDAAAGVADFLGSRDARWDDREAIVFLMDDNPLVPSSKQVDRYSLGALRILGLDRYTIASVFDRVWLPASEAGASVSAASGVSASASGAGEQSFLLEEPSGGTGVFGALQSLVSPQAETITLSELKTLIAEIAKEIVDGGGSEEYRECIYLKYQWEREVLYVKGGSEDAPYYYSRYDREIGSGLPAGTEAYADSLADHYLREYGETEPSDLGEFRIIGRDEALFVPEWPGVATLARPLTAGEYKFYFYSYPEKHLICDGMPEAAMKRYEVFVAVTSPSGVVHEAFFDPVAIGTGVGADASNGTLSPTGFTVGGTSTTLQSLKWESRSVTLTLSPYASLSGQTLDFIELDGTVSLRLDADSATVDATKGALSWAVASKPWSDGDQLMLRIRLLPCTDGVAVPNPTDNPGLVADCQVLLDALPALLGPEDDPIQEWSDDKAMDNWRGVRMAGTPKRVTQLALAYQGLAGTIPPELGKLDALTKIDLRGNKLKGSVPAKLGDLLKLEYLNLKGNGLTGAVPPELGKLTNLETLYLNDNELSGRIPVELGKLTKLKKLYLSDNQLAGDIPAELGNLSQLSHVYILANNELTGCVPAAWEDIAKSEDPTEHGLSYCTAE